MSAAWEGERNVQRTPITWTFTTTTARSKLEHLYPPVPVLEDVHDTGAQAA